MFACFRAEVAQLVEQTIRNRQVGGSIPPLGSNQFSGLATVASSTAWKSVRVLVHKDPGKRVSGRPPAFGGPRGVKARFS
jgi:hypothetical protein